VNGLLVLRQKAKERRKYFVYTHLQSIALFAFLSFVTDRFCVEYFGKKLRKRSNDCPNSGPSPVTLVTDDDDDDDVVVVVVVVV